jgi:hypothetical protein
VLTDCPYCGNISVIPEVPAMSTCWVRADCQVCGKGFAVEVEVTVTVERRARAYRAACLNGGPHLQPVWRDSREAFECQACHRVVPCL